jgi:hypothetical protein
MQLTFPRSYVDAGVAILEKYVVPQLNEAIKSFAAEQIEFRLEKEYEVKNYSSRDPSAKFQGWGRARKSDGYQIAAPPVFFTSDGETIKAAIGKNGFDKYAHEPTNQARQNASEDLVTRAIKAALDNYFAAIAERW